MANTRHLIIKQNQAAAATAVASQASVKCIKPLKTYFSTWEPIFCFKNLYKPIKTYIFDLPYRIFNFSYIIFNLSYIIFNQSYILFS